MDLNKVILVGRVTADPQVRSTPGGQSVTTIGVATNSVWTDKAGQKQEQTEFHNVVLWGRTAEIAGQYLTKGAMVLIEGRLQTRSWTDKNGQQRKTTEVMAERMQLGPRAANAGGGGGNWQGGSKSSGTASASSSPQDGGDKDAVPSLDEIPVINLEEDEIKPEDIPF
jgi:single-strand DNA-binding protein